MKDTRWDGPCGTPVLITSGSSQPPLWALRLIDKIVAGDRGPGFRINVRWTKSQRGSHGYTYGRGRGATISIMESANRARIERATSDEYRDRMTYIVIHELAHALNKKADRHGDGFYDALVRIARRHGLLRLLYREHTGVRAPLTRAIARAKEVAA